MTDDLAIDPLLSADGWAYASTPPVQAGDPGRYHALFGRDSLIFALQVLPERPDVAAATLRALAALQGGREDPEIDEEPGKILHEYRTTVPDWHRGAGWAVRDGGIRYYGSADSTSWFLVVLAATGQRALVAELDPAWRAAAGWLERTLQRGRGLVRYGRDRPGGLTQQGWRDSDGPASDPAGSGILRPDGTDPAAPLADADMQAVAVAALRALAWLEPDRADHWRLAADTLVARVSADFGPEVMAIDGRSVPVPGAGSQLGWLLWADALDPPATRAAAERLSRPDVMTGFGLRTLSSEHPCFLERGYHRGTIWPFDSWLGWGGLRAAGAGEAAERVRTGVLGAIARLGRAPELYAVTAGGEPVPARAANLVQAWSVGAVRALRGGWDGRPVWLSGPPAR